MLQPSPVTTVPGLPNNLKDVHVNKCLLTRGVHLSFQARFDTHLDTWAPIRYSNDTF